MAQLRSVTTRLAALWEKCSHHVIPKDETINMTSLVLLFGELAVNYGPVEAHPGP